MALLQVLIRLLLKLSWAGDFKWNEPLNIPSAAKKMKYC